MEPTVLLLVLTVSETLQAVRTVNVRVILRDKHVVYRIGDCVILLRLKAQFQLHILGAIEDFTSLVLSLQVINYTFQKSYNFATPWVLKTW